MTRNMTPEEQTWHDAVPGLAPEMAQALAIINGEARLLRDADGAARALVQAEVDDALLGLVGDTCRGDPRRREAVA